MIIAPSFIKYNEPFIDDGLLYHFTKADSFFKILDSLSLRPSMVRNLNDINEGRIWGYYKMNDFKRINAQQFINEKCSLLSFTKSYNIQTKIVHGTNRPSMWAHYADNSNGVCIVLKEKAFRERNKKVFKKYFGQLEDVQYDYFLAHGELEPKDNSADFVKANYKKIFFTKHKDWENENERRLLLVGADPDKNMLSIDGCIAFIAMGRNFGINQTNIDKILQRVSDPNHICYHKFIPHTFAMTTYSEWGYWTTDAAFQFFKDKWLNKRKVEEQIEEYFKWLHQEGGYVQF